MTNIFLVASSCKIFVAPDRDLKRAVRPHAAHGDDQRVLVVAPGRPSTIGTVSLARTLNRPRLSGGEGVRTSSRPALIGARGLVHLSAGHCPH